MTTTEYVSAEHTTNPIAGVWVLLSTYSVVLRSGTPVISRFEVTTSTGYKAILPACGQEACQEKTNCVKPLDDRHQHKGQSVDNWLKHCKTHCHEFHRPKAEAFAAAVAATYR